MRGPAVQLHPDAVAGIAHVVVPSAAATGAGNLPDAGRQAVGPFDVPQVAQFQQRVAAVRDVGERRLARRRIAPAIRCGRVSRRPIARASQPSASSRLPAC
ncbi:hypothetical protein Pen02_47130 [Plantactinospora endophytica]|uniref:Uncharacterized protein n=1 Tax=Plantactinospora endophytica TaxID=673535 RepID=A0ABQ4E633_9ACTN|nr:hypothetical protein Pen02_47130 [Plantactinospora endophytica]